MSRFGRPLSTRPASTSAYAPAPGLLPFAVDGLSTPCVFYDDAFLSAGEADVLYERLRATVAWEKTSKINRWVALVGDKRDDGKDYKYRDQPSQGVGDWTPELLAVKKKAEDWYNQRANSLPSASSSSSSSSSSPASSSPAPRVEFNVCLLNFYENGMHRIGWHADREEIGRTTPIASVSLGAPRQFAVRPKQMTSKGGSSSRGSNGSSGNGKDSAEIMLGSGSLCVMDNICQHRYVHAIPRDPGLLEGRINLTFRCKTDHTAGERMHERRAMVEDGFLKLNSSTPLPPNMLMHPLDPKDQQQQAESAGGNSGIVSDCEIFGSDCLRDIAPEPSQVRWLINAQVGAETFVAGEAAELMRGNGCTIIARPWGLPGYVSCSDSRCPSPEALVKLLTLRSAVHVLEYHHHFTMSDVAISGAKDDDNGKSRGDQGDETVPSPAKRAKLSSDSADCLSSTIDGLSSSTLPAPAPASKPDNGTWDTGPRLPPKPAKPAQPSAEDLYAHVKRLLASGALSISSLERNASVSKFRVSCNRLGNHPFNSVQVEFEVGGAIDEHYTNVRPAMKKYDVNIRCDIVGSAVILGTQCNSKDLSKRHKLKYVNRVTIKSNLAYILLRAAAVKSGTCILDPFCGSGTLLLEAAEWLGNDVSCVGLDVNRSAIAGAKKNAAAEGAGDPVCAFHCLDARALRKVCPDESVDAIVTNLPWGVQTGKHADLEQLYEVILRTGWYALKPGGRLVMLVLRGLQMMRILRRLGGRYRMLTGGFQVVRTTNNLPCICVVEKLAEDRQHDALKRQLYHYSQFVNVSAEMYRAIHMESTGTSKESTSSKKNIEKK